MSYNGTDTTVDKVECNGLDDNQNLNDKQIFSIIFTGNKTNECKLQHYSSKYFLMYKDSFFTLVSSTDLSNIQYQLFMMSA